jgi:hypothetical protein
MNALMPQDFVQQVMHMQTGARIRFTPKDNVYKDIIQTANNELEYMLQVQDWTFRRKKLIFGHTLPEHMEFVLPHYSYKLCTGINDGVRLIKDYNHCPCCTNKKQHSEFTYRQSPITITVPFLKVNTIQKGSQEQMIGRDYSLKASWVGQKLIFSRRFIGAELHRIIETDVIKRFKPLHICIDTCRDNCKLIEPMPYIPDMQYLITKVASVRCAYDPVSNSNFGMLDERANKLMSQMRANDVEQTAPTIAEWKHIPKMKHIL